MSQDKFISPGILNFDDLHSVHGDETLMAHVKQAIFTEGPVAFAFQVVQAFFPYSGGVWSSCSGFERANHAVYAFGWGIEYEQKDEVEYIEALNSWGTNWGVNGKFRIHPLCITDVTIPGTIESNVVSHEVPDLNEYWPWKPPKQCPTDEDGCVTDMEKDKDYDPSETCFSSSLNGKKIRVEEFDTELGYDYVLINGKHFHGTYGVNLNTDLLTSIIVDESGLKFASDSSIEAAGFKLCPVDPSEETNTTETTTTAPDDNSSDS